MKSSRFFFLIASGMVLMLLLPMGCSEEKLEKPQKSEKAEKPIQPSGPAPNVLPALKLEAFADLPLQEPLAVTPAMKDGARVYETPKKLPPKNFWNGDHLVK